nr:hypothetical protein [Tanacetum cinerariifolium]
MPSLFADTHNLVAVLEKSDASEGFAQIIDFLSGSYINYALTVSPHIYISCIKQFWNAAVVKRTGDITRLQALVDKKKIKISENAIREILQLDDAEGVVCLLNDEIFAGLAQMGYEKPSTKLTFYKAFFSSQWKFLIHTILQSLSAKRTSWNEFSTAMASAVICLSKGQRFNFSRTSWNEFSTAMASAVICLSKGQRFNFSTYIFDRLVRNVDSSSKFYMYPRFIQLIIQAQVVDLSSHTTRYISPALTQREEDAEEEVQVPTHDDVVQENVVEEIADDEDSEVQEVVEVVNAAKLITKVVTAATTQVIPAAESVVVAVSTPISAIKPKVLKAVPAALTFANDKGKGIFVEDPKPMKKKDQIAVDAEYARKLQEEEESLAQAIDVQPKDAPEKGIKYIRRYHGYKKKPQSESQARKNMIDYLKNTKGFKMAFFKGKTYDQIRPIFQARFDANMIFLLKSKEEMEKEEEEIIKSINETPAQKAAKRRRLCEQAKEAEDLKKQLEVVADEDDDVVVEATPIGTKVPVVNYEIVMINNKPRY